MNSHNNWHSQQMVDEINKQSERDSIPEETLNLLLKMQADSEKESKLNSIRFWINLVVSVIAAIAAVLSAIPYILSLIS